MSPSERSHEREAIIRSDRVHNVARRSSSCRELIFGWPRVRTLRELGAGGCLTGAMSRAYPEIFESSLRKPQCNNPVPFSSRPLNSTVHYWVGLTSSGAAKDRTLLAPWSAAQAKYERRRWRIGRREACQGDRAGDLPRNVSRLRSSGCASEDRTLERRDRKFPAARLVGTDHALRNVPPRRATSVAIGGR